MDLTRPFSETDPLHFRPGLKTNDTCILISDQKFISYCFPGIESKHVDNIHIDWIQDFVYQYKRKYVICIVHVAAGLLCSIENCYMYLSSITLHCSRVSFMSSSTSTLPSLSMAVSNTYAERTLPSSSVGGSISCAELPKQWQYVWILNTRGIVNHNLNGKLRDVFEN